MDLVATTAVGVGVGLFAYLWRLDRRISGEERKP